MFIALNSPVTNNRRLNIISAVILQIGGKIMKKANHYLLKLKRGVFHRSETFALEGGIFFGPGSDPKGSFYSPKLAIDWYQPESVVLMEEPGREKGMVRNWLSKLGGMRKSA